MSNTPSNKSDIIVVYDGIRLVTLKKNKKCTLLLHRSNRLMVVFRREKNKTKPKTNETN